MFFYKPLVLALAAPVFGLPATRPDLGPLAAQGFRIFTAGQHDGTYLTQNVVNKRLDQRCVQLKLRLHLRIQVIDMSNSDQLGLRKSKRAGPRVNHEFKLHYVRQGKGTDVVTQNPFEIMMQQAMHLPEDLGLARQDQAIVRQALVGYLKEFGLKSENEWEDETLQTLFILNLKQSELSVRPLLNDDVRKQATQKRLRQALNILGTLDHLNLRQNGEM